MMRVAIRADSSAVVGAGHVMRDIALAQELAARGAKVCFVCRQIVEAQLEVIRRNGFALALLPGTDDGSILLADHSSWLGASWQRDVEETLAAVDAAGGVDWLIVDHYSLNAAWHSRMRTAGCRIAVIDDLADREYDCDLLVDQGIGADPVARYRGRVPRAALVLCGSRFALLRAEFREALKLRGARDGQVRRVLVSYGGIDRAGETLKALSVLAGLESPPAADVVIGAANPHRDEIEIRAAALPFVRLHVDTLRMAELTSQSDLAFGNAGGSALERCCLGLPSIVTVSAANQEQGAQALRKTGAALVLGNASEVSVEQLRTALIGLMALPSTVRSMGDHAVAICDGEGARRVVSRMEALTMVLRLAQPGDCDALLTWRNHEANRRHAFDSSAISAATHEAWFFRCLKNPATVLLVAEDSGGPVGVLRYDVKDAVAKVSVYLVPDRLGRGAGSVLLRLGEDWLAQHRPETRRIEAEILAANIPSMISFGEAGYVSVKHTLSKQTG